MNKNYKLTFEETFKNGLEGWEVLEESKVIKEQKKSNKETVLSFINNGEVQFREETVIRYAKENVYVDDGKLLIKANEEEDGFSGGSLKYTGRKFGKGLLEVEAKFPENMPGIWPKLFLHLTNYIALADVEFGQVKGLVDKGKNNFSMFAYFVDEFGVHQNEYLHSGFQRWPSFYPDMDNDDQLSEGWHVFGYEQTDIDVIFYIDGKECFRVDIDHPIFRVFDAEGELGISLCANHPELEACDENTKFPCFMEVKSIKFYEEVK